MATIHRADAYMMMDGRGSCSGKLGKASLAVAQGYEMSTSCSRDQLNNASPTYTNTRVDIHVINVSHLSYRSPQSLTSAAAKKARTDF